MEYNIFNFIISNILFLLFTISMLYLKKILFFEDSNKKEKYITHSLILLQIVISIITIFLINYNKEIVFAILLSYLYVPVTASSFFSRKERKWFSFIIFFPLITFTISIYNISQVIFAIIKKLFSISLNATIYLTLFYSLFIIVIFALHYIKNSPIQKIEAYANGKSLSLKEDLSICAASLILLASILTPLLFENIMPEKINLIKIIIMTYAFFLAIIIVAVIFNSNGRRYYESQTHRLERTLINTMADLVESRDENTGGHIKRTACYVEIIANELLKEKKYPDILNTEYIKDLKIAAPLHDIGKINVSDAILDKKGPLLPDEFAKMKTHTTAGYNILCQVENQVDNIEYIAIAKEMAKSHHEWINGKGYPEGISGDQIPLSAKIMAVADVFDALVSKRCYKEAFPLDKAYLIIEEESGSHFDPVIVEAFFAAHEQIEEVMKQY